MTPIGGKGEGGKGGKGRARKGGIGYPPYLCNRIDDSQYDRIKVIYLRYM